MSNTHETRSGVVDPGRTNNGARLGRIGLLALVVVMAFGGCRAVSMTQGLQFNQLVQTNAETAANAADYIEGLDCPAASALAAEARTMADQAANLASQSEQMASEIQAGVSQHAENLAYLQNARSRMQERWQAFNNAQATLRSHFTALSEAEIEANTIPWVRDAARLGRVREDAATYADAATRLAQAMLTAAEDFRILVNTEPGRLGGFLDDDDGNADPEALASAFVEAADQMMDDTIMVVTAEYTVPDDMSLMVGQFKWPTLQANARDVTDEWESFQVAMGNMYSLGMSFEDGWAYTQQAMAGQPPEDAGHRSGVFRHWAAAQQMLESAGTRIEAQVAAATDQIAQLADETQVLAAEATRRAWQARQVCEGGALPDDLPPLTTPFDIQPEMIPTWNSTFWDISSP